MTVSGQGQVKGDGFTRQLEVIKKYAVHNDIRIVKVYREEGVSGTTDDRHPLRRWLPCSPTARTVLVERLDRCARDLKVQESIITGFKRKGFSSSA
jgi:DNA invertase Pin-like site-specific DNA recombinase